MKYYIWCSERNMWWRAGRHGYTIDRTEAGAYSLEEATEICENANRFCSPGHKEEIMVLIVPQPLTPNVPYH